MHIMKSKSPHGRSSHFAFTLIELLVVIAIISILMGMLLPAISGAKDSTKRAQAQTDVRAIITACKAYANDYGKYPPVVAALNDASNPVYYAYGDKTKTSANCKASNNALFDVLRALDTTNNAAHILNKRRIVYLDAGTVAKDTKLPRGGFTDGTQFASPIPQGAWMDPWGTQYCVVLDAAGNDQIDMLPFFSDLGGTTNAIRANAVAFSTGKDGAIGGSGYTGKFRPTNPSQVPDDIVSWQ